MFEKVRAIFSKMEQLRRIELPSQPWQGRILAIVLQLHRLNIADKLNNFKEKLKIFVIKCIIIK